MVFREAEIKDLNRLAELEQICFPEEPWTIGMIEDCFKDPQMIFIVADEDDLVAYALMLVIPGVESQLCNIAVVPDYRGQGLAKQMLRILFDEALYLNIHEMTLEVRKSNLPAQKLYESFSFINEGIRPGYYQDGEDAIIMWNRDLK